MVLQTVPLNYFTKNTKILCFHCNILLIKLKLTTVVLPYADY